MQTVMSCPAWFLAAESPRQYADYDGVTVPVDGLPGVLLIIALIPFVIAVAAIIVLVLKGEPKPMARPEDGRVHRRFEDSTRESRIGHN